MKQYLELTRSVIGSGTDRKDRTGVGTRSIFGYRMRLNPAAKDLFAFRFEDFTPEGHNPRTHIPGDNAV